MGREMRFVPRNWEHPKESDRSARGWRYTPLFYGWKKTVEGFKEKLNADMGVETALKFYGGPNPSDYMDAYWEEEGLKPELFMMYETISEGTPISPAFETDEDLARWLAETNASAFASSPASYDAWLSTIRNGAAVSAMFIPGKGLVSGVEALHKP